MQSLLRNSAFLALGAAVLWGGGDFSGGMGVKHVGRGLRAALKIVLLSHAMSLIVLTAIAWFRGDPFPHGAPLGWSVAAGIAGGVSLTCFYMALSHGSMGASAAISGLLAAGIPALVSIALEGFPGPLRLLGFGVAGTAIWLIAGAGSGGRDQTMGLAIASGVGFGVYFVALKLAGTAGVIWPMAVARVGSLGLCSLMFLALILRRPADSRTSGITSGAVLWAIGTAFGDTSGNLLFLAATRAGRLDVAAVLASLYPASTILLAAWTLGERPTRRQAAGMAIAAAAVVMITV